MIRWSWYTFPDLRPHDLYAIMRLRQVVFVVEQQCAFLDADGKDEASLHLMGLSGDGQLDAYLRLVPPGLSYPEPSIGRVITSRAVRGSGAGKLLMAEGIRKALIVYPGQGNRISAQAHLERFYNGFGYIRVRGPYDEDGIPHLEMLRSAGS
jgi:ElaA protein